MADITKEDVIEFIANMSVLDLSLLVKEMEEKFGVSAAAPMAVAFFSSIFSLNPVQRIIGMSGRMFRISLTSVSPVILGMVRSVITKSN